nr:MAG TPA: hypothetical protein [Caudoviricetes sp.]
MHFPKKMKVLSTSSSNLTSFTRVLPLILAVSTRL